MPERIRIPHQRVPVVDESGRMAVDWYRFFTSLMQVDLDRRYTLPEVIEAVRSTQKVISDNNTPGHGSMKPLP